MVKQFSAVLLGTAILIQLLGCTPKPEEANTQIFAMNTMMTLSALGGQAEEAVRHGSELIYEIEGELSVTQEGSDIWNLNHSGGDWVPLSPHALAVLEEALTLAEDTAGAMDPTIYPLVSLWGFTTGAYHVPSDSEREELLSLVDYTAVELDKVRAQCRIPQGMTLDLGAITKGYTADLLMELFEEYGVTSAMINLGGNVQTLGTKPDGSLWRVGVQDPTSDTGDYLGVLSSANCGVVTSGGYQRFFEEDGETYWHIIDPKTGSPAHSGLTSVTIVSPWGTRCDGLSTAIFVMGLDRATEFWRETQDFDMVLVGDDGTIYITQGLVHTFALTAGDNLPPLEVISP